MCINVDLFIVAMNNCEFIANKPTKYVNLYHINPQLFLRHLYGNLPDGEETAIELDIATVPTLKRPEEVNQEEQINILVTKRRVAPVWTNKEMKAKIN